MAKTRIVMNRRGMRELLRSPAVRDHLHRRAQQIAQAAGPGMEASAVIGKNRARASVITGNRAAREAEARGRALSSAIDAGRRV